LNGDQVPSTLAKVIVFFGDLLEEKGRYEAEERQDDAKDNESRLLGR
jgi:hypothetical protein